MYLATSTCPDIAYTVSKLACYNRNPGKVHWISVQHQFRCLKSTVNLELTYRSDHSIQSFFSMYSNADFGIDLDTQCSTGGYLVCMSTGAVSWSSKAAKFAGCVNHRSRICYCCRRSYGFAICLLSLVTSSMCLQLSLLIRTLQLLWIGSVARVEVTLRG